MLKLTTIILVGAIAVSGCANKQAKDQARRDAKVERDAAVQRDAETMAAAAIDYAMAACKTSPAENGRRSPEKTACLYERTQQYLNNFQSNRRRSTTCINSGVIITCTED